MSQLSGRRASVRYDFGDQQIRRCRRCELLFLDPWPTEEETGGLRRKLLPQSVLHAWRNNHLFGYVDYVAERLNKQPQYARSPEPSTPCRRSDGRRPPCWRWDAASVTSSMSPSRKRFDVIGSSSTPTRSTPAAQVRVPDLGGPSGDGALAAGVARRGGDVRRHRALARPLLIARPAARRARAGRRAGAHHRRRREPHLPPARQAARGLSPHS